MSNAWFFISFIACYCGLSTGFSTHSRGFMNPYPRIAPCLPHGPTGDPLFLTPYIESGHPEVARSAARVPPLSNQIQSYSGYLTVDKRKGSNLFFWYFPPTNANFEATPVALWLQGGPGGSSMFGLLSENGPITFDKDLKPISKPHSWSEFAHMIYIDSPVGTGFSFTKDEQGYATNEEQIAQNLYYALVQFFQIFPELKPRPFFLTGESYAGKYVPALAHVIHVNNANGILINLQGVAIGNGLVDPENMMKYSDYLYEHGLVDTSGRQKFKNVEDQIVDDIKRGKFDDATVGFESIFKLLSQSLAPLDVYNYVNNDDSKFDEKMSTFFCQSSVRKRIHVGNLTFNDGVTVQRHLINDMMRTVKQWFVEALYNYRVLIYNGQLDIVVAYPLTVNFLERLDWSGAARYKTAERRKWTVDGKLAGFVKNVDNFTEILVRDAGHMVPTDQPKWAQRMMKNFFYNVPF